MPQSIYELLILIVAIMTLIIVRKMSFDSFLSGCYLRGLKLLCDLNSTICAS